MFEAIDEGFWTLLNIFDMAVCKVGLQHRDDFVVSLLAINHPQSADWFRLKKEVALSKRLFGQYTNVHRVTITLDPLGSGSVAAELGHLFAAITLRNEAVQRWAHRR